MRRTTVLKRAGRQNARARRLRDILPAALAGVALAVVLAGCVAETTPTPSPVASVSETTAPSTPTSSSAPAAAFVPGGTAAQNKPFFDAVNEQVVAAAGNGADGPAFITALRSGGFPVEAMEVTPDITTVGVKADSIQFSVHAADACLIGQWSNLSGYTSIVAAPLSTGKCLIGQTRAIDF